jgi:hypothetical protein
VAHGVQDELDHLADDVPVAAAGDDRDDEGVAGDRLGVLAGQVAGHSGGRPGQPGVLDGGGAVHAAQLREGDDGVDPGVGARAVRDEFRAQEQLAAFLQRVVEPLCLAAQVLGAVSLAQRLAHGADRGRAFRRQVPGQPPRPAERLLHDQPPVAEPVVGILGIGAGRLPLLHGLEGQHPQVLRVRARGRGGQQDLLGLGAHVFGQRLRPGDDLRGQRPGQRPGRHRGLQHRAGRQLPHPLHLPPRRGRVGAGHPGQPRRRRRVPVSIVAAARGEPRHVGVVRRRMLGPDDR